jgi:hypothetical protein
VLTTQELNRVLTTQELNQLGLNSRLVPSQKTAGLLTLLVSIHSYFPKVIHLCTLASRHDDIAAPSSCHGDIAAPSSGHDDIAAPSSGE